MMKDPISEQLEADAEPGLVGVSVGTFFDWGPALGDDRGGIGPGHGESDDDEQGIELVGVGETGILDVEAACFAVTEQAFDLPSFTVGFEGLEGRPIGGDDEAFALGPAFGVEGER